METILIEEAIMKIAIYHNPKCSKSRATMKILKERGVEPDVIDYLENPPSAQDLTEVIRKLNIQPKHLVRFNEALAKDLNITPDDDRSDEDWVALLADNPILIERPIVVTESKAAIGRPPEDVLNIL